MTARKLFRYLWQLPVILLWRLGILIALKTYYRGFVICDITSTQSKYREHFKEDVQAVVDELDEKSPNLLHELRRHVRYIARADIYERFEYYSVPRLLLLYVDYELYPDLRLAIERDLTEFVSLANSERNRYELSTESSDVS